MYVCIFTNLYTQYKIKITHIDNFAFYISQSALFCGFFQDPFLFLGTQFLVVCIELLWRFHESESEVAQSFPTLSNPMDCSLSGSFVHGIFQARVLEWIAISFSRGSSQPRNRTHVSCIAGKCFTIWATREALLINILLLGRLFFKVIYENIIYYFCMKKSAFFIRIYFWVKGHKLLKLFYTYY